MNISISSSRYGITGLVVTLYSLFAATQTPARLRVFVFCCHWDESAKSRVRRALDQYASQIVYLDVDARQEFGHLPPFFGDYSTYTRLLAPELVPADRVLHLDADLLVMGDLVELEQFDFADHPIAATCAGGILACSQDLEFQQKSAGLSRDDKYFNAGVVYYNSKLWRSRGLMQRLREFSKKNSKAIPLADQSILNALFSRDFAELGLPYNVPWYPEAKKPKIPVNEAEIIHFVGSPKPWDPMGRFLHSGYSTYKTHAASDRLTSLSEYYLRAWEIRRSIARVLKRKVTAFSWSLVK